MNPSCYIPFFVLFAVAACVAIAFLPPYFLKSDPKTKPHEKLVDKGEEQSSSYKA